MVLSLVSYVFVDQVFFFFRLAYFVAKKGEKDGIFILSISICLLCMCCSAYLHVMPVFLLLHLFCNYFRFV